MADPVEFGSLSGGAAPDDEELARRLRDFLAARAAPPPQVPFSLAGEVPQGVLGGPSEDPETASVERLLALLPRDIMALLHQGAIALHSGGAP